MHDPCSLAFDIYLGSKEKKNGHYRTPIISIWHKDPEKDGSDDSCGWFIRARHIDPKIIERVRSEFEFNFKHEYWFNSGGYPKMSVHGIVLNMYSAAAWQIFMYQNNNKPDRKRYKKFLQNNLFDILHFAENPTDSIMDSINMKYGVVDSKQRISEFTNIIVADIFRKMRPWYKHPKWHVHHWDITFPLFRSFKRRWFDRCSKCGKRMGKSSAFSDWYGSKIWCEKCNDGTKIAST